ncbi:MAG: hypothetical protein GOP50_03320 [Candidatus Heimdallarchaeota archaeon]|nr:hypothetical protein [Candidatus Heimdallarchaeota archaeon]
MSYHDHIYPSYKEETIKILNEIEKFQFLEDPKIEPIIIALRKGPLTVRELENQYNELVNERIDEMDLSQEEKNVLLEKLVRKSKTLYKYLNELEKQGFVIPAGKRIVENQTASETLYGRTAKLFLHQGGQEIWSETEGMDSALKLLSGTLGLLNKSKKPSVSTLKNMLIKIDKKIDVDIKSLVTDYSEDFSKLAENLSYYELKLMFTGLKMLLLMKNYDEFEQELHDSRIL